METFERDNTGEQSIGIHHEREKLRTATQVAERLGMLQGLDAQPCARCISSDHMCEAWQQAAFKGS